MAEHSYSEAKQIALKTIIILAVVTVIEVFVALTGKGHLIPGFTPYNEFFVGDFNAGRAVMYLAMISMSLYKAYLVVFEFMHMRYEVKDLARVVLLPTCLLIWAIIAFFMEGSYWHDSRAEIRTKDMEKIENTVKPYGLPQQPEEVKFLEN